VNIVNEHETNKAEKRCMGSSVRARLAARARASCTAVRMRDETKRISLQVGSANCDRDASNRSS